MNSIIITVLSIIRRYYYFMLKKTIVSIAIGVAIGLSPLRSSALANFLIAITGG